MVIPDVNKITVFNRGIFIGLKDLIEWGGQLPPISILGESDIWKNAQKNDKKKKISEIINNNIPIFINFDTNLVWYPWKVLSRVISRHHCIKHRRVINNPSINKFMENSWNHLIAPVRKIINLIEVNKGQGLTVTKWYGWW